MGVVTALAEPVAVVTIGVDGGPRECLGKGEGNSTVQENRSKNLTSSLTINRF